VALSQQALEAAYRRLEKPLYNYLFRWFWNPVECEDLIHDAFERLWKRRRKVKEDGMDALVWTTVINLARNRHRWVGRWSWLPLSPTLSSEQNPHQSAQLDEREQQLKDALAKLSMSDREVILLDVFAGVDRTELANMLGIPIGTLASRKHAAIARLRRLLESANET